MSKWYSGQGKNSDVVVYSKIRLSRNLADAPFPARMSDDIRKSVSKKIYATVKSSPLAKEFEMMAPASLTDAQLQAYAEKRMISPDFAKDKAHASFLLSENEDVSVMLCEEDHIKINAFAAGQNMEEAYRKADALDEIFLHAFKLAYSDKLGFLTASPMNLGTALKASYVLHLPALARLQSLYRLSVMVAKLGLSLREMFRNGTGDFYILSNQVSLGISEKSAMENLTAVCEQIVRQERNAREDLKQKNDFEDKIYRTMGILKSARRLETEEFLNYLSLARLGAAVHYLDIDYETIGDMLYTMQDASLTVSSKAELTEEMLAKLRAQLVRERLE